MSGMIFEIFPGADGPGPAARESEARQGRTATSVDVRNLVYLALGENDQNFNN